MKRCWPPLAMPFHPQPTAWLNDRVLALRTANVNAYLVRGSQGLIVFDAGLNVGMLGNALAELDQDGDLVQAVFLTHGDSDHVGGLDVMPHASVYLGVAEEPMVVEQQRRFLFSYEPRLDREHLLLEDDQVVDVAGCQVRAIATPGHTPGSTCYLVDGCTLFAGDSVSLRAGHLTPFVRMINMDHKMHKESIAKIAQLRGIDMLCTGHSGISRNWERIAEPWRLPES